MKQQKALTYAQSGVDYDVIDPIKKLAQAAARKTKTNLAHNGFTEISASRGESAFIWQQANVYMASVIEGLGTKNLVADEMHKLTGKTYYDIVGHDTVATIINDLATSGAKPLVIHAYWAVGNDAFLKDKAKMNDLIKGWKKACDLAGVAWGGGETPTLKGVVEENTIDLGGSAVGIIEPKKNLITEKKLGRGDRILLLRSNGINANGLSLARAVAEKLPKGYETKLSKGKSYGEALLTKTNIYAKLVQDLLKGNIDIHYITNLTGHGMRKIMRARPDYSYIIEKTFEPQEVFLFIQKQALLSDYEMYQTFNMGQDYALFLREKDLVKTQNIVRHHKLKSLAAGYVEKGKRQVIIKPKNLVYKGETLDLR